MASPIAPMPNSGAIGWRCQPERFSIWNRIVAGRLHYSGGARCRRDTLGPAFMDSGVVPRL
jgi:hypothetical protein